MTASLPALQLQNFGVAFGSRVVLGDCNLQMPAQGVEVLMGPVKGGKSTLLRTLAGHFEGHALHKSWGQALMKGRPLDATWRPALVAQHVRSASKTLLEVLREARIGQASLNPLEWRQWAEAMLSRHGLEALVPALGQPLMDLDTVAQRCALVLAQALTQPALLMVDEPTYGLSESDASQLIRWLRMLGQHQRLWVVLHHQQQARLLADRIVLVAGGRVLAHLDNATFFAQGRDTLVGQFLRTGSLDIASPDADPNDLAPGVPAPPPLPAVALVALGRAPAVHTVAPEPGPTPPPQPVIAPRSPSPPVEPQPSEKGAGGSAPVPAKPRPLEGATDVAARTPAPSPLVTGTGAGLRRPAPLPRTLPQGVELAAMVGQVTLGAGQGPQGFRWIVPGMLAGCAMPGVVSPLDYDLDLLDRVGVTHLITLTEQNLDQDGLHRFSLTNTHLPIFDREAPSVGQMQLLLVRMHRLLEKGEVLAVHCKAGLGRTGLVLAAWLMRDGGLSAAESIRRLRRINPDYVQSKAQEDFLVAFEDDLVRRLS